MDLQGKLQNISSYTGKLLRRRFGRGPESCHASIGHMFLVIYIRGFISPMEEVLLQKGHSLTVSTARNTVMAGVLEELKGVVQITLDLEITHFYQDWIFQNNRGIIIAVLDRELNALEPDKPQEADLSRLESEVNRISTLVQRQPDRIRTYRIHSKLYVVVREGVLIPIEIALAAKGFEQELLLTMDELEKSYFHKDGKFHEIFEHSVSDIFLSWSIKDDTGIVCFVLT